MSVALSVSALLMGLASAPHCVAMCGAACAGVARSCGGARPQRAMAALQIGRLLGYSAVGALAAASVSTLAAWTSGTPAMRPLWSAVHLGTLLLGLWLLWRGQPPDWLRLLGRGLSRRVQQLVLRSGGGWWQAGLLGSAWVALPCGLLQSALVVAALAAGPAEGAAVMAAFAVGSGFGLWAGPALWWRFSSGRLDAASGPLVAARLGGALLVGLSAWALGHSLWQGLNPVLCLPGAG
jgi:sulfite exporter TauE/SafE